MLDDILMKEALVFSENVVTYISTYQTARDHIPEARNHPSKGSLKTPSVIPEGLTQSPACSLWYK